MSIITYAIICLILPFVITVLISPLVYIAKWLYENTNPLITFTGTLGATCFYVLLLSTVYVVGWALGLYLIAVVCAIITGIWFTMNS